MTDPRSLRSLLAEGRRLLGTFSIIPSPDVVEIIAVSGLDFVIIDMEHGPFGLETVRAGLLAARAHGLRTVVRVRTAEAALVGAALDVGADGVLVPQVGSADAARAVVEAARFAPDGTRGANPFVRAARYGATADWFAGANRDVAVMVMIEGAEGIAAMPEILEVTGLDGVFLGPVDMSHSLGVPGQIDHPSVRDALEKAAAAAAARNMATAVFAPDEAHARAWWELGIQLVACGVDAQLMRERLVRLAEAAGPPAVSERSLTTGGV
ncbi:HpcH/HpaI aldolase family protein [Actinoallomurus iriomotensis]|uniref:2,4-dihydroxyhept-2-ene-1,7-dioic acid aldolase n=1 Tax=Actinoallomurus iriomotensis TaxID=478107 RepID=A0A9W6VNT9_9ACTN|nr:aldolase/citrate lyase family protein [Actinoallomurus iriomotensis]GLY72876.1 2,4-dihydroxyhept-2-ene-1,7-dioic acid aldolase [Actinoallomurus iriomotensis]